MVQLFERSPFAFECIKRQVRDTKQVTPMQKKKTTRYKSYSDPPGQRGRYMQAKSFHSEHNLWIERHLCPTVDCYRLTKFERAEITII